jgi:hypothetical protein
VAPSTFRPIAEVTSWFSQDRGLVARGVNRLRPGRRNIVCPADRDRIDLDHTAARVSSGAPAVEADLPLTWLASATEDIAIDPDLDAPRAILASTAYRTFPSSEAVLSHQYDLAADDLLGSASCFGPSRAGRVPRRP